MNSDRSTGREASGAPPSGLFHSLRSLGPAVVAMLRTRLELFGIEVSEEKGRAAEMALLGALALLFAGLFLLMLNVLVLAYFWESHRFAAILALILLYGTTALLCGIRLQSRLATRPPMFEATLAELKADLEALNRVRQD